MYKLSKALLVIAFCLAAVLPSSAQITLSPYSHYGLGDAFNPSSTRNYSMGNTGIGTFDGTTINRINPASYADLRLTTLDFSGFGQYSMQKSNLNSGTVGTAGFHNVSLGFSNKKGYGFVAGLAPYSGGGYLVTSMDSIATDTGYSTYQESYSANGGLSQFYIGAGVRFLRNFSAGLNLSYAFGTTNYYQSSDFTNNAFTTVNITQRVALKGLIPQAGLQFGDTMRIRRELERAKVINNELKALDEELEALAKEETVLNEDNAKLKTWAAEQNAEVKALEDEKRSNEERVKGLMNDEIGNEKEIRKLQESNFRLEKKRKRIIQEVKAKTKELEESLARIAARRTKIGDRKATLNRELEDIQAGKKPATEVKRQAVILRGGLVYEPSMRLQGERLVTFNNSAVLDTLSENTGGVKLPAKYGVGFSLVRPGRWSIAADLAYTDWNNFNYFDETTPMKSALDIRVGGEWIPDLLSQKFRERVAYRLGFYQNGASMNIDGQDIKEMGVTFGVGLPIGFLTATGQNFSRINVGFGIGNRGTTESNLLQETTFHLRFGVNLNDIWFIKRRIE